MANVPTKDELLARTRAARAAWEAAFAAIPRDQLTTPGATGDWSAKDVQTHLTADHRWIAGQLRAHLRGELPTAEECYGHTQTPPPGIDLADQDQRNAWRHSIDSQRPLDEALTDAPHWADALESAIAALPDDEFARPYTFADYLHVAHLRPARDGEPAWTLASIIDSFVAEHYTAHTNELRTPPH
jgi:Mycothiol maleylpyruvate isomerase N-terminal domain